MRGFAGSTTGGRVVSRAGSSAHVLFQSEEGAGLEPVEVTFTTRG